MDSLEIALLTNLQKNHHFTVEKLKDKRIMSIKEKKFSIVSRTHSINILKPPKTIQQQRK